MKPSPRRFILIILGLTLLAFLLRVYRLERQSYWIDEAWTLFYAHQTLPGLLESLRTIRAAPPLYHLLTIYWIRLAGDGEYALRFLSVLPSVMAVPLVYRLGRLLGGNRLGLLAALLFTISPYQIWHAQDARNYSMLTAASVASMWSFIKLWRQGGRRWWLLYGLSTAWTVFTHYHGLVIIGVQGLFFLLTWPRHRRYYLAWGGALLVILLPLAAWLVFGSTLWQNEHWLAPAGLGESYIRSATAYSIGELVPPPQAGWLTLAFVVLYALGLVYAAARTWRAWRGWDMLAFLLAFSLAPNLAIWLYSQLKTPIYLERYLIVVQTGYLLAVAMGMLALIDAPRRLQKPKASPGDDKTLTRVFGNLLHVILSDQRERRIPKTVVSKRPLKGFFTPLRSVQNDTLSLSRFIILAIVLFVPIAGSAWVLSHHYTDPAYAKPNWRGVIQMIEAFSLPGDAIVMTGDGGEKLFDYYYRGNLPVYHSFNTPAPSPAEARRLIAGIAVGHERLWYTPYGVEIDPVLEGWLAEHAYPAWQSWLGRKRLALYDTQARQDRLEPLDVVLSDGRHTLTLLTASLPRQPVPAGDLLPLALRWQTPETLTTDYHLSLRLVNQYGDIFAQSDWPPLETLTWPPNRPVTDRRSLWLPVETPPGRYNLQLVVYDPNSGQSPGQPVLIPGLDVTAAPITPPLEALSIPNPIPQPLLPTPYPLKLIGYVAPAKIRPGQAMWLWLYWQATAHIPNGGQPDGAPELQLSLVSGDEQITSKFLLTDSTGSLAGWQPGQVRKTVYHLPTSPRLSGRQATLEVRLKGKELASNGPVLIHQFEVPLETRPRRFDIPPMTQPTYIGFGDPLQLKLIGYDGPPPQAAPGETLSLTLYWQAETEMAVDYTIFVQLLNRAEQVVAQVDRQPQAGQAPTTTWLPGEIVTDAYHLPLPGDLPGGEYRLITGLYETASGRRLPLVNGGDFVEVGRVRVE